MYAVTIADGALRWSEHPDPVPGAGEVLVKVMAAGINGADRFQLMGLYPAPPGSPADIPGLELAGEVAALGPGVERFGIGDRVMAIVGGGGQAELCVVHERHLLPIPESVDWAAAGGFAEAFTTAHDALFGQAELAVGERLCVHGAAGGVGIAAVQLGIAAGASVVATVRNEALRDQVAAFGPTVVAPDGFGEHGPFDVVLELIGGSNIGDDVRSLATGGRIAVIGTGAGAKAELNLLELMGKRGRIHGSTLRARNLEDKALAARGVEKHVLPLLAAGTVTVPVEATYPMAEAAQAYEHFAAGGKLGKIVLVA
ncbi:MAG: zinc-binding dehydrogenase [Actinobacteria bacterium]|nr:zinc-binding dehydrogenase [Actinomycetota bacterium]